MRILSAATLVLGLAVSSSTALDAAPTSLRYVIAIFRHGIRSPMESEALPNNPNKEIYKELAGGHFATLTSIGKRQMYGVGKCLKDRYGRFIGDYQEGKVNVTSTKYSCTVMSAQSVMAGLLPPSPNIFRDLSWQPVPVWADRYDFEKGYVFMENKPSNCPKYSELSSESSLLFNSPDDRKQYKTVYKLVQEHAGESKINTPAHLYNIFDNLYFAHRNGLQLPEWSKVPRNELKNRPLFPDALMPFAEQFFESKMYHQKNEDMLNIFAGPLLNIISSSLLKISSTPSSPDRFWYHSTHDTTIYPLLRGLKVDDPLTAEPGDGVIFELHIEKRNKYVKMFMYNCIPNTMTELNSPLCPNPCTLAKFSTNLKMLTPKQWDRLCNK